MFRAAPCVGTAVGGWAISICTLPILTYLNQAHTKAIVGATSRHGWGGDGAELQCLRLQQFIDRWKRGEDGEGVAAVKSAWPYVPAKANRCCHWHQHTSCNFIFHFFSFFFNHQRKVINKGGIKARWTKTVSINVFGFCNLQSCSTRTSTRCLYVGTWITHARYVHIPLSVYSQWACDEMPGIGHVRWDEMPTTVKKKKTQNLGYNLTQMRHIVTSSTIIVAFYD